MNAEQILSRVTQQHSYLETIVRQRGEIPAESAMLARYNTSLQAAKQISPENADIAALNDVNAMTSNGELFLSLGDLKQLLESEQSVSSWFSVL